MDPELFNQFGLAMGNAQGGFMSVPTAMDPGTFSAVDSSGNSNMPTMPSMSAGQGLGFIGDFLGAYGYEVQGQEEQQAYDYNAQLALTQGQFKVEGLDKSEDVTLSTQRAMYAKAGVTMSGSPLDVALNTASNFEMDKAIANYNAESKSNMYKYEGEVAKQQADYKASMSVLSGIVDLGMMFL